MKKAQELPLNIVVIGALALFVLLLVGGILLFGGGDMLDDIGGLGPGREEVALTTFLGNCGSKCRVLSRLAPNVNNLDADGLAQIKSFCCESADLNGNGLIEVSTMYGPEICSLAYGECRVSGMYPNGFCRGSYDSEVVDPFSTTGSTIRQYDFTRITYDRDNYDSSINQYVDGNVVVCYFG